MGLEVPIVFLTSFMRKSIGPAETILRKFEILKRQNIFCFGFSDHQSGAYKEYYDKKASG